MHEFVLKKGATPRVSSMKGFFTKEECQNELAKAEANMIILITFLEMIEQVDFVPTIDDTKMETTYRILKKRYDLKK